MSTPLRQNLTFNVGRLIGGSVETAREKDRKGKQLTTKDGRPRKEWSFGVAYEKNGTTHWSQLEWGAVAWAVGTGAFPQLFQADGSLLPGRTFSWKITDGDSQEYNTEGNRPCDTPEWKGCWIVWYKSAFPPTTWNENGTKEIPASQIKPGMYVQVAGSIDSNGDAGKPGIYMNHAMVALAGHHPDGLIVGGPDPSSAGFGQGAKPSNLRTAPAGGLPPGGAPAGAPVNTPPPAANTPPAGTPPPPAQGVRPHTGIMTPGSGTPPPPPPPPPAAAPPPPPPPPPSIQTTDKAGGSTWEQLKAAGWTEAVARQHGMIV
ncbi:MAG: hypothetical protein ACREXP_04020 [Steroidobacteraceae bacterium]